MVRNSVFYPQSGFQLIPRIQSRGFLFELKTGGFAKNGNPNFYILHSFKTLGCDTM
jgi:hypothetical protein